MTTSSEILLTVVLLLSALFVGRNTARYNNIWRVKLEKWARILLLLVDVNVPTVDITAIIWQIPTSIICTLFVLKTLRIDIIYILFGFSINYDKLLLLQIITLGTFLGIITFVHDIFFNKNKDK